MVFSFCSSFRSDFRVFCNPGCRWRVEIPREMVMDVMPSQQMNQAWKIGFDGLPPKSLHFLLAHGRKVSDFWIHAQVRVHCFSTFLKISAVGNRFFWNRVKKFPILTQGSPIAECSDSVFLDPTPKKICRKKSISIKEENEARIHAAC